MADSIGVASDLAESVSKAGVVFGSSASAVEKFAETSATSFGISKRAAYEATGMFGNLFKTIGYGEEQAAAMSVDITKLAADLASFHNIGIEEAFEKLRSGLVGEAEPMRQLGVLLSAAAVEAKGFEMGLGGANGKLTEADKVTARYQIILEQTADAQGDFARTSDGLANSQKQLAAQMEDVQATVGEALIPVVIELATVMEETLIPALQTTADLLTMELPTGANTLGQALDLLGTPFNIVKDNVGQLGNAMGALQGDNEALIRLFERMPGPMGETGKEMRRESDAAKAAAVGATDMSAGLLIAKAAAEKTKPPVRELGTALYRLEDAALSASEGWDQLEQNIEDSTFLKTYKDRMRDFRADIRQGQSDLEEALRKGDKAGARAARIAIAEAEAAMRQLRMEFIRMKVAMAKPIYVKGVVRTGAGAHNDNPEIRHGGGPVEANTPYIVGGRGAEELFVPRDAGMIYPNAQAAGAGNVAVAVYLDSDRIAARVERRQYFAASVAPASIR